MANLKEQVEAYATYIITAGVTAIVAVGGTIGVQAFRNWLKPGPINQNELSVNMLNNGTAPKVAELRAELTPLETEEAPLIQAVRENGGDPNALPAANAEIPADQAPALTDAIAALRNFRAQHAERMTELRNQIDGYDRLATFLRTEGNSDVLEYAIRHATRVAPAPAPAPASSSSSAGT